MQTHTHTLNMMQLQPLYTFLQLWLTAVWRSTVLGTCSVATGGTAIWKLLLHQMLCHLLGQPWPKRGEVKSQGETSIDPIGFSSAQKKHPWLLGLSSISVQGTKASSRNRVFTGNILPGAGLFTSTSSETPCFVPPKSCKNQHVSTTTQHHLPHLNSNVWGIHHFQTHPFLFSSNIWNNCTNLSPHQKNFFVCRNAA